MCQGMSYRWLTYPLPVSTAFDAGKWTTLYLAIAGTSGVLLGLFLVAFTVRLQEIESIPVLRNRARTAIATMVLVLLWSICVLIPDHGAVWLGREIIAVELGFLAFIARGAFQLFRSGSVLTRGVRIRLLTAFSAAIVLPLACGISLIEGRGPGLYLLIPQVIAILPVFTFLVWDLLWPNEIRSRETERGSAPTGPTR